MAMTKKEEVLRLMELQLEKDPKRLRFETSCYGRRESVSSKLSTMGPRHTRYYGEAPYLSGK